MTPAPIVGPEPSSTAISFLSLEQLSSITRLPAGHRRIEQELAAAVEKDRARQASPSPQKATQATAKEPPPPRSSGWQSVKQFLLGTISPITSIFRTPKNLVVGAATIATLSTVSAISGGAAVPYILSAGGLLGGFQLWKYTQERSKARDDGEKAKSYYRLGEAFSTLLITALGVLGQVAETRSSPSASSETVVRATQAAVGATNEVKPLTARVASVAKEVAAITEEASPGGDALQEFAKTVSDLGVPSLDNVRDVQSTIIGKQLSYLESQKSAWESWGKFFSLVGEKLKSFSLF